MQLEGKQRAKELGNETGEYHHLHTRTLAPLETGIACRKCQIPCQLNKFDRGNGDLFFSTHDF